VLVSGCLDPKAVARTNACLSSCSVQDVETLRNMLIIGLAILKFRTDSESDDDDDCDMLMLALST